MGDEQRFGVRCRRCARTQPPALSPTYRCVYCGTPLPVRRWMAHPPPGVGPRRRVALFRPPYTGPPAYRGGHPAWGFPPVTWRSGSIAIEPVPRQVRGLRVLAVLAALTAAACAVAAAGETWRFLLLLRGRTNVLAGPQVRASDVLVQSAAFAALVLGVVTAAVAVSTLARLHRVAAERAGHVPARTPAATVARLVVPGWNLYGAGQVLVEIVTEVRRIDPHRRITRWAVPLWWAVWAVDGLLVFATLVMAFGRSAQWMADTVEMHIAVDLAGAVTAGLFAAIVISLHRSLTGRGPRPYDGWSVRLPESTARNRSAVVPAGSAQAEAAPDGAGD